MRFLNKLFKIMTIMVVFLTIATLLLSRWDGFRQQTCSTLGLLCGLPGAVTCFISRPDGSAAEVTAEAQGDHWTCLLERPLTAPGRNPQHEVAGVRVAGARPGEASTRVQARYGSAVVSVAGWTERTIDPQGLRLPEVRPVDPCSHAQDQLMTRVATQPGADSLALVVPVQCLLGTRRDFPEQMLASVAGKIIEVTFQ